MSSSQMEDIVVKMMVLQEDINQDTDDFVDLKQVIIQQSRRLINCTSSRSKKCYLSLK